MNGAYQPFRVLKKKQTGVMYIAIPDMLRYFETSKNNCKTTNEENIWEELMESFSKMIYEGIDHDL